MFRNHVNMLILINFKLYVLCRLKVRKIRLEAKHSYKKATVAFQDEVSVGTIMTIIAPAPRIWHLFFLPDRYFIKLKPDLSRGLDIIIELNRGMEGDLNGLNAEIFNRIQ